MSTFVSIGNTRQPFTRMLDAVAGIASKLPQPVVIQHGHTPVTKCNCKHVRFLGMEEFADQMNRAELVILHAGAGSVIHAIQTGKVPVIMPRRQEHGEHVNNHQLEFARAVAKTGKAVIAGEPNELEAAAQEALRRQGAQDAPNSNTEPRMAGLIREVLADYARQTT